MEYFLLSVSFYDLLVILFFLYILFNNTELQVFL